MQPHKQKKSGGVRRNGTRFVLAVRMRQLRTRTKERKREGSATRYAEQKNENDASQLGTRPLSELPA